MTYTERMSQTRPQTILFADVSGSTRLFETKGDVEARRLIAAVLDALSIVCVGHGGRVIKTIGDEIMCTLPTAMSGLLLVVGSEFVLGLLLGLGAMIVLSGLQLAGQVVDQQIGLQFGSIINPDLGGETAISSQLFFMLGGMAVLLMEPIGGHLMLVQTLIETFDAMPVGQAVVFGGTPMLLTEMVHQSLLLAVQVAAPVLATMSLVTVCLGYLGHCVPQFNQLVVGFPIRSAVGILVLAVTLSGVSRVVVDAIPESIRQMQIALSG